MTGTEKIEKEKTTRESRAAGAAHGPAGVDTDRAMAALKRYLAAEEYHAKRSKQRDSEREPAADERPKPSKA